MPRSVRSLATKRMPASVHVTPPTSSSNSSSKETASPPEAGTRSSTEFV